MNIKDIFKWAISLNSFPLWFPIRLMESLSLTYTANSKRQIQVENFSKYEQKMSR